jgi:hypothetical protein
LLFINVIVPRNHWLIDRVLQCFGDVGALRSLQSLLDLHAGDKAVVVVLFDLLIVHLNL